MSFDEAVALIDSNHPFVINMEWNSGGKHAVVCSGYNLDTKQIQIIDPWGSSRTRYYSFYDICRGTEIESGTGHADSMVIY
ncbi:MAG: C39 family peptidase [Eubacterium sp.]